MCVSVGLWVCGSVGLYIFSMAIENIYDRSDGGIISQFKVNTNTNTELILKA